MESRENVKIQIILGNNVVKIAVLYCRYQYYMPYRVSGVYACFI